MNTPSMSYVDAFPGRFLSADHFKGQKVTLTVADVFTEGIDKTKKRPQLIMKFKERPLELCLPKTNAYCIKMMFGYQLADWVGKKITFFPSTCRFGLATVDCIRVWGSPDIEKDMILSVPQGRQTPLSMTMHAIKVASHPVKSVESVTITDLPEPDPPVIEAWSALGWSRGQGHANMSEFKGENYLGHLSSLIDQMNAQETTF
jgi:hypothetical protein